MVDMVGSKKVVLRYRYRNYFRFLQLGLILFLPVWFFYKGYLYVYPERQVGIAAWMARCLSITVGLFLSGSILLNILHRKLRRRFIEGCLNSISQRRFIRGFQMLLLVIMLLVFLGYGLLRAFLLVPLMQDIYDGPTHDRVVQVEASHEVKRVQLRHGAKQVPVMEAEVLTASGDKIQVQLRADEWERYAAKLQPGQVFIYYPHSHIWQPSSK